MPRALSKNLIGITSSLLLLGALSYVLSRKDAWATVVDVCSRIDAGSLLVSIGVMTFVQVASGWRLKVIMEALGSPRHKLATQLRIQLVALFIAHGTPISAFADVAKAAMVKLRFDVSFPRALRMIVYERLCAALGAAVIGIFALATQGIIGTPPVIFHTEVVVFGLGLAGLALIIGLGLYHLSTGIMLLDYAASAIIILGRLLRRIGVSIQLLLASLLQVLGMAAAFLLLGKSMHLPLSVAHTILFMPVIFIVNSLPIFYQGWGGREATVIATIGMTSGMSTAESIALSASYGVVVFLTSLPGAVFWLMRPSMRHSIQQAAEQAQVPAGFAEDEQPATSAAIKP